MEMNLLWEFIHAVCQWLLWIKLLFYSGKEEIKENGNFIVMLNILFE